MPRAFPDDVRAIRPTTREPLPFVITASLLVDTYLADVGLPTALLTEIEKWWAAHLMECADPMVVMTRLGETSVTRQRGKTGLGLNGTPFGQQVLLLYPPLDLLTTTIVAGIAID